MVTNLDNDLSITENNVQAEMNWALTGHQQG